MSEEFDKKLINRINEVFEGFEDDTANEGWAELRKSYPVKERKHIALWWYSSAAALLIITSIWLFSNNDQNQPYQNVKKQKEIKTEKPEKSIKKDIRNTIESVVSDNKSVRAAKRTNINEKSEPFERITPPQKRNPSFSGSEKPDYRKSDLIAFEKKAGKSDPIKEPLSSHMNTSVQDEPLVAVAKTQNDDAALNIAFDKKLMEQQTSKSDSIKQQQLQNMVKPSVAEQPVIVAQRKADEAKPNVTTNTRLPDITNNAEKTRSKADKNVIIGLYAGSYFNYAKGSETSVNTGFGVSSDIRVSKRIKVSTGISLGQNSLKFTESAVPPEVPTYLALERNSSSSLGAYYSPASDLSSNLISSYSINTYDAKLVALDIPINIKYSLLSKKNMLYLSTGFSSNFYIDESYNYNYSYKSGGTNAQNVTNLQTTSNFQSFNFARVVNFSLGYDRPISNNTRLSLEPFVKYPLSGLGSHDLRFGAAGINLKLNFNGSK
jgi:hypothetical protein